MNWNGFTATDTATGYNNILQNNTLGFFNGFENQHPYVLVTNIWDNMYSYTDTQIKQMDKEYLYNYLAKYYSAPTYSEGNTDMKDRYTQNFKNRLKMISPYISDHYKSKIALMSSILLLIRRYL